MRTYCTLFDKNYLLQGVALYESLRRCNESFRLVALCMDDAAYQIVKALACDGFVPVSVDELLTPEVRCVRERTTHGQFCWVCQPLVCEYVLDNLRSEMVTYLESDSLFFSSPEVLFEEIGDKSASLVPHNFSSEFDNTAVAGKYCVQFNAFRNDSAGREVLQYWKHWCFRYDKSNPHYYPGQVCLNDWPERFNGVAVIRNPGAGVAPWNVRGFKLDCGSSTPRVDGAAVVFYHFHQYGRRANGDHELGNYPYTKAVIDCFYAVYVRELREADRIIRAIDSSFSYRREYSNIVSFMELMEAPTWRRLQEYLEATSRRFRGRYNIYSDDCF